MFQLRRAKPPPGFFHDVNDDCSLLIHWRCNGLSKSAKELKTPTQLEIRPDWSLFTVIVKEFSQQRRRQLYVVNAPPPTPDVFDFTPMAVDRLFNGWLRAVEDCEDRAGLAQSPLTKERLDNSFETRRSLQLCKPVAGPSETRTLHADIIPQSSPLTTQDYINVMLVTIRESGRHACWPTTVVAAFLAADVIR